MEELSKFTIKCKRGLGLLRQTYMYLDTVNYLADKLFIKHKVRVNFDSEYGREDRKYRFIFCSCWKKDCAKVEAALKELPNKMLLLGYDDYMEECIKIVTMFNEDRKKDK